MSAPHIDNNLCLVLSRADPKLSWTPCGSGTFHCPITSPPASCWQSNTMQRLPRGLLTQPRLQCVCCLPVTQSEAPKAMSAVIPVLIPETGFCQPEPLINRGVQTPPSRLGSENVSWTLPLSLLPFLDGLPLLHSLSPQFPVRAAD